MLAVTAQESRAAGEPQLFEQELDAPPVLTKMLFRVEVEKRYTDSFYLLADTREEANADADELAADTRTKDMELDETDVFIFEIEGEPEKGYSVWTGGENGKFVDSSEVNEYRYLQIEGE